VLRRFASLICTFFLLFSLAACSKSNEKPTGYRFTDALGNTVTVASCERVVAVMGSYAETWMLAGGTLVGVTDDAISERGLDVGTAAIVGSVKTPNLEEIIAADPDFVILSADIAGHLNLQNPLSDMGISAAFFRVETFSDYLSMLQICTDLTGNTQAYETYGLSVEKEIAAAKTMAEGKDTPRVLFIRAFSTGAKAKGADNMTGAMLSELGADNLVDQYESLLEDLSMEEIVLADPDHIFITTMGDEMAALDALEQGIMANPAWDGLTAVKNGNVTVLPKALFHYKPNARWGESYQFLAELLYGEK